MQQIAAQPAIPPRSTRARAAFLAERGWKVFAAIGAIVLALTGARRSTPTWATSAAARSSSPGAAWCCLAWRSTTWARGAADARSGGAGNPFFRLFPERWLLPALVLATLAAIIARRR